MLGVLVFLFAFSPSCPPHHSSPPIPPPHAFTKDNPCYLQLRTGTNAGCYGSRASLSRLPLSPPSHLFSVLFTYYYLGAPSQLACMMTKNASFLISSYRPAIGFVYYPTMHPYEFTEFPLQLFQKGTASLFTLLIFFKYFFNIFLISFLNRNI